jgi:hypothetical protein
MNSPHAHSRSLPPEGARASKGHEGPPAWPTAAGQEAL